MQEKGLNKSVVVIAFCITGTSWTLLREYISLLSYFTEWNNFFCLGNKDLFISNNVKGHSSLGL